MRSLFDHEDLRVYQAAIGFVAWLEEATPVITSKVAACDHLARASAGVPVNIAEASGKRSMKDRCRFIGHARIAALQAAATLDVLAARQATRKQDVSDGKSCLADIVRLLVAWERTLEERWLVRIADTVLVHLLVHTNLLCIITAPRVSHTHRLCYRAKNLKTCDGGEGRDAINMGNKIKIGVSTCLLGEPVRYDGGHKMDRYITGTLGQYFAFVPVCPEVECGLPVPREAMRLVGDPESPRLVTIRTGVDHTERMIQWAKKRITELAADGLCGFIFKSRSPSSGMQRVKVYGDKGIPQNTGVGIFARIFMEHFPRIPAEEEGRLHDLELRENFIERIFALKRWRETLEKKPVLGNLVDFHTRHKLLILSHSPAHYREMGKLVAEGKTVPAGDLYFQYESLLMAALALKTTLKKNANVLHHLMGYFKKMLSSDEKQEVLEIIDEYREGHIPLIVPITLINHYVRKYHQPYLEDQIYLRPHPVALQLRNHA